jgi:hypothetical protein
MKPVTLVVLLAVCGAVMHAQTSATPSGDVTIKISEGTPEYCLDIPSPLNPGQKRGRSQLYALNPGEPKPGDITLRLPLRLKYENNRSESVFLPRGFSFSVRANLAGQNGSLIERKGGGGPQLDVKSLMALPGPEAGPFWIVDHGKDASLSTNLSVLRYKDAVDDNEFVLIPVIDSDAGVDLRGKTVQIAITRDFRSSIAPDVVVKLNEKWKDRGTVWTGVAESETISLQIPKEPLTRKCSR